MKKHELITVILFGIVIVFAVIVMCKQINELQKDNLNEWKQSHEVNK